MNRDQFGEFVCGYWGLKVKVFQQTLSVLFWNSASETHPCICHLFDHVN